MQHWAGSNSEALSLPLPRRTLLRPHQAGGTNPRADAQSLCFLAGQMGSLRGGQCLHACDQLVGKRPLLSLGRNSMDKGRAHHGESQSPVQSQFSLSLCVWETPHRGQGGWLPGPRVSSQTPGTGQGKAVDISAQGGTWLKVGT